MADTSTTWKSLTAGFALGVISTVLYFPIGIHVLGAIGWGGSLVYIGYAYYEAQHPSL